MNNEFTLKTKIFASDCDDRQLLRHDAILNFFQNLATTHAVEMKTDYNTLKATSNAFWVITKIKFKITGKVRHNDDVELKTWPLPPQTIRFLRDFSITSKNGKVDGASEWCILDCNSLALRRLNTVSYPVDMPHKEERADITAFTRFNEEISDSDFNYRYKAVFTDIDVNGHVNNVSYAKMALNTFTPKEFSLIDFNAFEIHFISQSYFGDEIDVYRKTADNGVFVEGKIKDKTIFKCLFYKE